MKYDFLKAHEIIEAEKKLGAVEAIMGMEQDWNWTAETVWPASTEVKDLTELAGIDGSYWATPILRIKYNDGKFKCFDCGVELVSDRRAK